jgi:tetratricopeptide (TPR) repeat protein
MINVAELDERIDRCLAILADNPHSQVFAALAEAYRRRGEFGRAFSVCKSGLKHHPDYAPAYVVLAKLYLHQKMLPDALSSLARAVELDGPTRVTDILEAEIQLALGDVEAAQTVLERLRITDPGNAALPDLIEQVKRLRSELAAPVVAAPVEQTPQLWPQANADPRPTPDCADWPTWVKTLGVLRDIEIVFVSDAQGRIVAQYPETDAARTRVDLVLSMLREVTAQFSQRVWGSVCEIRIETRHGDVWVSRLGDAVVGLVGLSNLKFSETRRRGLDLAGRVQDQPSILDAPAVAES